MQCYLDTAKSNPLHSDVYIPYELGRGSDGASFFFFFCKASRFASWSSSSCPGVSLTVPLPPACCCLSSAISPAASGCAASTESAESGSSDFVDESGPAAGEELPPGATEGILAGRGALEPAAVRAGCA